MTRTLRLAALALCLTCLAPFSALAEDEDDFSIPDRPAVQPVSVYHNFVELGVGYASDGNPRYGRFSGLTEDGPFPIGNFGLVLRGQGDDTAFIRGTGHRLGQDSRSTVIEGGQQGSFKLLFGYDQQPSNLYRGQTPFTGEGSSRLSLPSGWARTAGTPTSFTSTHLAAFHPVDIKTDRQRYRAGATWNIDPTVTWRLLAQHEDKEGVKARGGPVNGTNSAITVPEPVNYRSDRFESEFGYAGKRMQWRMIYHLSQFENADDSVLVENPYSTGTGNNQERLSLPPSNIAHSASLDGGWEIGDSTRLTSNLSYSRYMQDNTFLPFSANPVVVTTPLPRNSLDGTIVNTVANVELYTRPAKSFDVKTRYRYTNRDNQTPVGQFVYVQTDNEATQASAANSSRRRFNIPYSYEEHVAGTDLGFNLTPRTKLLAGYEYRNFQRSRSERSHNYDQTGRLQVRSRLSDELTGSLKYARMWRDGSTYVPEGSLVYTNAPAYYQSTPYDNHKEMRKFFEADLVKDSIQAGLTYAPTQVLTLGATGGAVIEDYRRSQIGLTNVVALNGTLDASLAVNPDLTLTSFYTFEQRRSSQAGWQGNNIVSNSNPSARWWLDIDDNAHTLGAGARFKLTETLALVFDYTLLFTQTLISDTGLKTASSPGNFPEILSNDHVVALKAEYDLNDQAAFVLGYAFERLRTTDWQLDRNTVASTPAMTLGQLPPNYDAHMVTVSTRYRF